MLSAKRDARAAERFFCKAINASHNQEPRVINVDKEFGAKKLSQPLNQIDTLYEPTDNLKRVDLIFQALPPKNQRLLKAIDLLTFDQTLPETIELGRVKYLNNIVELRTHRFIKRRVNLGMGFGSFNTARRTLRGYSNPRRKSKSFVMVVLCPLSFVICMND